MSRRAEGSLFIGRLSKNTRVKDLEDIFESYGRLLRCDIKYGPDMAFGFVDFEDRRDAEDALRYENGHVVCGTSIIVEWAKGTPRTGVRDSGSEECYKCHRPGHIARDCREGGSGGGGYRSAPRGRFQERSRSRSRSRRSRSHERRRGSPGDKKRGRSGSKSPRPDA